jgi:3-oxoadipate enol-lactonase
MRALVNGFQMSYEDTGGAGVPLVLIHGYPLDHTMWAEQLRELSLVARVIAPDLRGCGDSELPSGDVSMDVYADDIRMLLDVLEIPRAVIVGLSMGGYITFAFYRQYASRVRALVLADTRANPDSPEGKRGRDDSIVLAREKGAGAIADKLIPLLLAQTTREKNSMLTHFLHTMLARHSVASIIAQLGALRDRPDSTSTLAQISVPTLIVVGSEDVITPVASSEAMRDGIRGSQMSVIPGAGHMSNMEKPELFNRRVAEFLRTL